MDDRNSGRFGRYEILTELGSGAMGVVYKARDPKINRVVAVKTISLAGQPPEEEREYRQRFVREAEAAGRLSHPGIVTIFDVGEEPETRAPYIVMEFVGGQSLDRLLSRDSHTLSVETALQLTSELAEALDCAHAQGVVHRDLKPANILLTEDGHAKIADFGVAKLNLSNQTLAGRTLGTPAYMSPEQLNGEAVDGRSDLFSLGVVLYTMLTGHRPFQGNSAITVSFKVVNRDPIPATLLNAELPEGLDRIIARAMAKDPAERYQSGKEMLQDIQSLREARERLGNAKPPGSPIGRNADRMAKQEGRFAVICRLAADATPEAGTHLLPPGKPAAENLVKKIRNKSYAGVSVLAGLFIFGLWVISFGPQGVRPRAAAPLPVAREIAQAKTAATLSATPAPSASAAGSVATAPVPTAEIQSTVASAASSPTPRQRAATRVVPVAAAPSPTVEKLLRPIPAGRIYPTLAEVARVRSSAVSPADSSATSPAASPAVSPATLEIEVDHQFAAANLSIWVDDRLTYTHRLEGTDKKRLVVFHHVEGHEFHVMQVSPGKHHLRVQVAADAEAGAVAGSPTYDQSATVAGDFGSGQQNVLRISFKKHGEMNLSLQ
ncbi:MAG: protein kinase [Terriglobales bacterium]